MGLVGGLGGAGGALGGRGGGRGGGGRPGGGGGVLIDVAGLHLLPGFLSFFIVLQLHH